MNRGNLDRKVQSVYKRILRSKKNLQDMRFRELNTVEN